ncbi:peptidyl-tRNA hydrolase-like protein 2 [Amylocarpus encephaloides]|uniref:peptidyl-tRNA hydrolase n=1 Tax=Amylocarpus encephaloides TaxID=45428 RepID=A0A9P7YN77_9HELO|nr:peptidyl-tRNA hydrolase-like protein 2 [Amylocarpus encephaloides]
MSQPRELSLKANLNSLSLGNTKSTRKKKTRRQRRESPQPFPPVRPKEEHNEKIQPTTSIPLPIEDLSQMSSSIRLLVCSIGNPAPYTNTLHSAGHLALSALRSGLQYPNFSKSGAHGNGLISHGSELTLWQSNSLMNISGACVSQAWRRFQAESSGEETKLVVVHDELELGLGDVKVRDGGASAKGHNGLKNIKKCMSGTRYTRIGVGIGRPESREPDVVARYVLRKMNGVERAKIEGAWLRVEEELRKIQEGL